jgi:hypothetical protein
MNPNESVGSATAPVNLDDYDLMADPKRRARSNAGGIRMLKEHLVGGYVDALMCSKITTEIRKEMRAYLKKINEVDKIF